MFQMSKIRLITLDMTGTVFKFKQPPILDYIAFARKHGVDHKHLKSQIVKENFNKTLRSLVKAHPHFGSTSHLDSTEWWWKAVHGTFAEASSDNYDLIQTVGEDLYEYYSTSDAYTLYPDAVEFLRTLKERHPGLKTGIISNFDKRLIALIPQLGLGDLVDFKVVSETARCSKPDARIFQFALDFSRLSDLKASEALHIGDDVTKDYCGARNAGWKAKLISREGIRPTEVDSDDVYTDFNSIYYSLQDQMS